MPFSTDRDSRRYPIYSNWNRASSTSGSTPFFCRSDRVMSVSSTTSCRNPAFSIGFTHKPYGQRMQYYGFPVKIFLPVVSLCGYFQSFFDSYHRDANTVVFLQKKSCPIRNEEESEPKGIQTGKPPKFRGFHCFMTIFNRCYLLQT